MVEINNLTSRKIDEKFLKKVAKIVLGKEIKGLRTKNISLSIALVGRDQIKELNKKYRHKNRATDVLAFGEDSKPRGYPKEINQPDYQAPLGEIVICMKEVEKNAKRFGVAFEKELKRVLIHGVLHILGYDHGKTETETKKMWKKEEYYLSQI